MSQNRVLLAPLLEIIFTGYTNEIQRPRNPVAERGVDRCPNPTSLIPKAACLCIPLGLAVFTLPSPPKVTSGTRNCALPLSPLCSLPSRGRGRVCATGAARTVSAPSPGLRSQEPPLRESPQAKPQRGLPCDKRLRANASAVLPDAAPVGHPAQGAGPPSAGCLGRPGELPSLAGGTGASQPLEAVQAGPVPPSRRGPAHPALRGEAAGRARLSHPASRFPAPSLRLPAHKRQQHSVCGKTAFDCDSELQTCPLLISFGVFFFCLFKGVRIPDSSAKDFGF